jgi:hypothetical protein
MEWLEYFKLGGPPTIGEAFFLMWFCGAVGGYCFGRAHAAWIRIDSLIDTIDTTITKLDKGGKVK